MARKNKLAQPSIKYRGFCQTQQKFVAPWRSTELDAEEDCARHKRHGGNGRHIMKVIVEERTSVPID